MRRPVRNAFLLGILVGLVIAVVRALRGDTSSPAVSAGSPSLPRTARPAPPVGVAVDAAATGPAPVAPAPRAGSAPEPPADVVAPVEADPMPDPPATADPAAGTEVSGTWVAPAGGECPDGHPVKAKEASKIFHVPGGAFYERTQPDCCYRTAADAEADGYRVSKR